MSQWRCSSQAISFHPILSTRGATFLPDGCTKLCIGVSKEAHKVTVRLLDGLPLALLPDKDGCWCGTFDLGRGFQYLIVMVDGLEVLVPDLPIGFGCSRPMNFVDIPTMGDDFYQPGNWSHGSIAQHFFFSKITEHLENCLVYLPPFFNPASAYPMLYLQHGHGENETGWLYQGRMNFILDRLIALGKAEQMLVVMCNGMAQCNGEIRCDIFPRMLVEEIIPYIEQYYNVLMDKWHRAMAGLSMGSMHTSMATMTHPEMFGYAGLFSGFLRYLWSDEQPHLKMLDDATSFAAQYRVYFRAMGREDTFLPEFEKDDAMLAQKGVVMQRRLYDGGHEWQVWRQCLRDFLPMLFRGEE